MGSGVKRVGSKENCETWAACSATPNSWGKVILLGESFGGGGVSFMFP